MPCDCDAEDVTTDQSIAIQGAYADAFGEDHAEQLLAPNYVGNGDFLAALADAVKTGHAITSEDAIRRFGQPFHEGVI